MDTLIQIPDDLRNELIEILNNIYKDNSDYKILDNVFYPAILSKTAITDTTFDEIKKIVSKYRVTSTEKNSSFYRKGYHLKVYIWFN